MSCVLNIRQSVKKIKKKVKKLDSEVYIGSGLALALLSRVVLYQPMHPDVHNSHKKFEHVMEFFKTLL